MGRSGDDVQSDWLDGARLKVVPNGSRTMKHRNITNDTEAVVRRAMKLVHTFDTIGKQEFDAIHALILQSLQKNTGISMEEIVQKTDKVLKAMPNEYGQLDERLKSWEALIGYLYAKYLKELGVLPEVL